MKRGWIVVGAAVGLVACSGESSEAQQDPAAAETAPSDAQAPDAGAAAALLARFADAAGTGPFAPRDECAAVEGAAEFRLALAEATVARDMDALAALADPQIMLDFGGGAGVEELRTRMSSAGAAAWQDLERLLPLGCAYGDGMGLTMPWHFAQESPIDDPYAAMVVTGQDRPVFAAADAASEELAKVSWDMVTYDMMAVDTDQESDFLPVTTRQGIKGFMREDDLRALIDYRLGAENKDGEWKLTYFIAGD